jgi:hypothetical protein
LYDHFEDLVDYHRKAGRSRSVAERLAADDLGQCDLLASAYRNQPALKGWVARHDWLLAGCAPMLAASHTLDQTLSSAASRWMAGLVIASVVTASMMLLLQLSITVA